LSFEPAIGRKPLAFGLFQIQQAFYKVKIRFGYFAVFSQIAFPFLGLFCQDVTFERFLMRDLSCARYLEAFFGTGIRFNLWHTS